VRSEHEIREVYSRLGREPDPVTQEVPAVDWRADTFRFGYLAGKLVALRWAVGAARGSDVGTHYDYEDWQRAMREAADEVRAAIQEWLQTPSQVRQDPGS
jgi:hypothetical protein